MYSLIGGASTCLNMVFVRAIGCSSMPPLLRCFTLSLTNLSWIDQILVLTVQNCSSSFGASIPNHKVSMRLIGCSLVNAEGSGGLAMFSDFLEIPNNSVFNTFDGSGALGTILDQRGMQKRFQLIGFCL